MTGHLPPPAPVGIDESDTALLDLKAQRDQLVGHRRRVEKMVARDDEVAKALVNVGKKEQAMVALRKKKQHCQLIADCEAHISKVDGLIDNIEVTRLQKETVDALKAGIEKLRRMQKEIGGADAVQRLMDENEDAMDEMREISQALAGAGIATDDAEALAELKKLEEEHALEVAAAAAPAAPAASAAVASPPASSQRSEESPAAASTAAAPASPQAESSEELRKGPAEAAAAPKRVAIPA